MSSSASEESDQNGPLRHDGNVPSASQSLTLLLFPQAVGLFAFNRLTYGLQLAGAAIAIILFSLIGAGIIYYDIERWAEKPEKINNRRLAYTIAGGLPILGPLMWIKIRS